MQEHQAVTWGRRLATKIRDDEFYWCMEVVLYKQPITTVGELEFVKILEPYKRETVSLEELKRELAGSDFDIDQQRYPYDEDDTFG